MLVSDCRATIAIGDGDIDESATESNGTRVYTMGNRGTDADADNGIITHRS